MTTVRDSLVQELGDVAEAIGALNQSYSFNSIAAPDATAGNTTPHAACGGSGFADQKDDCDCDGINFAAITPKDDPNNTATSGAGEGT